MKKEPSQVILVALIFIVIGIFIGIFFTSLNPPINYPPIITTTTRITTTTTFPTTTTTRICPTIMACLYNPTLNNYTMFTGCDYIDAKSSGWIETNFTNPNYCNTDDDCFCSLTKCFRGNKYYANCVQDVNACQMSYCPFTPEQRMVCIDHFCQIGTI